jgi:hypothetical protein
LYPTSEALETYSITEIALKDTPTREPFWIVNEEYDVKIILTLMPGNLILKHLENLLVMV